MAPIKAPTAQELRHRVAFDKRIEIDDGAGNTRGEFQEQFLVWAALRPRGGSEAVVADRLEGRNMLGVYLRSSSQARQITNDWRMRDARDGEWVGEGENRRWAGPVYAIKIVDAVTDRRWVYLEAQTGVAP
ncbi:MAG TPA: head-tail adaptor protein [Pseudorhizobium sp.]|nr:head-tail adaptor protein [Pseudorhizobium sp.]